MHPDHPRELYHSRDTLAAHKLDGMYAGYAFHILPSLEKPSDAGWDALTYQRRFVYCSESILKLELHGEYVHCHGIRERVILRTTNIHDVAGCKFMTAKNIVYDADDTSTIYWFRFRCGTIATFRNPTVPMLPHVAMPRVKLPVVVDVDVATVLNVVSAIGASDEQALEVIRMKHVPSSMRLVVLRRVVEKTGITDGLLRSMDSLRSETLDGDAFLEAMHTMQRHMSAPTPPDAQAVVGVVHSKGGLAEATVWKSWLLGSDFARECTLRTPIPKLDRLCQEVPMLYTHVRAILKARIDHWSPHDWQLARILVSHDVRPTNELDMLHDILFKWQSMQVAADSSASRLYQTPPSKETPFTRNAGCKTSVVVPGTCVAADCDPPPTHAVPPLLKTHTELVGRFGDFAGRMCTLIGSGLYMTSAVADVVMHVPTREEACAVLGIAHDDAGADAPIPWTFEGTPMTVRASSQAVGMVPFTTRLLRGLDTEARVAVGDVHRWFAAAGLKGSFGARTPGFAITCLAAVLCRSTGAPLGLRGMLCLLRDAVMQKCPSVDFDRQSCAITPADCDRSRTPLEVLVHDAGGDTVCTMTTGSTRHLLDALTYTVMLEDRGLFAPSSYSEWRQRTMLVAATLAKDPTTDGIASMMAALKSLDGHPLIDAVYVAEGGGMCGEDGRIVRVLVTLDGDAPVDRYGFRDGDRIEAATDTYATVHHGVRSWPLQVSMLSPTCAFASRTTVLDRLAVAEDATIIVPNAPTLTVDVINAFDRRAWTWA